MHGIATRDKAVATRSAPVAHPAGIAVLPDGYRLPWKRVSPSHVAGEPSASVRASTTKMPGLMAPDMRSSADEREDGAACSRGHRWRRCRVCGSRRHCEYRYAETVARDRDRQGGATPAAGPARADIVGMCKRDSAQHGIGAGSPRCVDGRVGDAARGSRERTACREKSWCRRP